MRARARHVVGLSALAAALSASAPRDAFAQGASEVPDIRGPVRVGTGWSNLYHARVVSLSFEDELRVAHLARGVDLHFVFGMDGVRGPSFTTPGGDTKRKGFLAVDVGPGILLRSGAYAPAFVLNATMGPSWESGSDDAAPHGFGVAGRAEVFPFYLDMKELVHCERGMFRTYVLSGINAWALARQDWMGSASGATYAVGLGIELGRHVLAPVLGVVLGGICAKPS